MTIVFWAGVAILAWCVLAAVFAPFVGAAIAGRSMTHGEREAFGWGVLGLTLGLFVVASILFGSR